MYKKTKKKCGRCGNEYIANKPKQKYCSKVCFNVGNKFKKGFKDSLETSIKRSIALIGNKRNYRGGLTKLSISIRNMFESRQWRSDVFKRDDFTCQDCYSTEKLEIHHIKPMSYIIAKYKINSTEEARVCVELWDINNGRTLCHECHLKTDTYGGKAINYIEE